MLEGDHNLGSRRSLADTSVTSTADLSVFSTITRSQAHENSLDTHSNLSDNSMGGASSVGSGIGASGSQRLYSAHNTPISSTHNQNPDVLRIYVPYSPLETPVASPQNGDIQKSVPCIFNDNKVRIKIDNDELPTPLVEHGRITSFHMDTELDLK